MVKVLAVEQSKAPQVPWFLWHCNATGKSDEFQQGSTVDCTKRTETMADSGAGSSQLWELEQGLFGVGQQQAQDGAHGLTTKYCQALNLRAWTPQAAEMLALPLVDDNRCITCANC